VLGMVFACKTSWGVKRGQRNVDILNLHRTVRALHMSFSEPLEVQLSDKVFVTPLH
jgi:hypothetical protein